MILNKDQKVLLQDYCGAVKQEEAVSQKLIDLLEAELTLNGYDSFIMFNVYAQRATNPDDMEESLNEYMHAENMKAFEYVLSHSKNATVWAAWGSIVNERGYLKSCVREMIEIGEKYNAKWVHAGKLLKNGHPHHPLYLCKTTEFEDYDIKTYVDSL